MQMLMSANWIHTIAVDMQNAWMHLWALLVTAMLDLLVMATPVMVRQIPILFQVRKTFISLLTCKLKYFRPKQLPFNYCFKNLVVKHFMSIYFCLPKISLKKYLSFN